MKNLIKLMGFILLSLLLIQLAQGQLAETPWPMKGHDIRHSGQSPHEGSSVANLKWDYKTENRLHSSAAINSDGTVYVGSDDNYLYALNPNGSLKWKFQSGDDIRSSPAIGSDGTIYIGSRDNYLYAINPDGTMKWKFQTGDNVDSSPVIGPDGTIYVGSWDHNLYAVKQDGTMKWKIMIEEVGSGIDSSPAIGPDGTVYVGTWGSHLYAINPNGTKKWKFKVSENYTFRIGSPTIESDGTIYFTSEDDGYLYALNPQGIINWRFKLGLRTNSSPAISSKGSIYVGSWGENKLYAINTDGTLKWKFQTGGSVTSSPVIGSNGTIYIGSYDNYFYAISPDGNLVWKFMTDDDIWSSAAINSDGTVYVGSRGGKFYAFGTTTSPSIIVSQRSLHFGSVMVGSSKEMSFKTINGGDVTLSVSDIKVSSSEFVVSPSSFEIGAGSSQEVRVSFIPSSVEGKLASLTIKSNDAKRPEIDVYLSGNMEFHEQRFYLQPDSTLNEVPYYKPGAISWSVSHFIYSPNGMIEWKYPLKSKIFGSLYNISLMCGSLGFDGTHFSGKIILRTIQGDVLLASTTFWGGTAAPPPLSPQRVTKEIIGFNPSLTINDTLIFRVMADSGDLGIITYGDPLGQSYITVPLVLPTDVQDITLDIPIVFELSQNYPNPFNPSTTIKYQLATAGHVVLTIYNLAGQELATVVNEFQIAGEYEVNWQSNGLPSGLYFYRLRAGDFSETKKLILQK